MHDVSLPENPTLEQYLAYAADLVGRGTVAFAAANGDDPLEAARIQFLGDRRGELLVLQKGLGALPADARRDGGRAFNEAKLRLTAALEERRASLKSVAKSGPQLDLTMPARERWRGGKHPVTLVIDEIVAIFRELGFT